MSYVIAKSFGFSAGHYLPDLPVGHPCRRQHGHNYVVTLVLQGEQLDEYGMVLDYGELRPIREAAMGIFDHQNINDLDIFTGDDGMGVERYGPTAEWLAEYLWTLAWAELGRKQDLLHTVVVQETGKSMAAFSPHGPPIVWTP